MYAGKATLDDAVNNVTGFLKLDIDDIADLVARMNKSELAAI